MIASISNHAGMALAAAFLSLAGIARPASPLFAAEPTAPASSASPVPAAPASSTPASGPASCVSVIDAEVVKALKTLKDRKPARSGIVHLSFPTSKAEIEKFNRMAIVAVRVFVHDLDDLPIDSVYFLEEKTGKAEPQLHRLVEIFTHIPIVRLNPSDPAVAILGGFEYTTYTFIPLHFLSKAGELGVRFGGSGASIPLLKLPIKLNDKAIGINRKDPKTYVPDPRRGPDMDAAVEVMKANYCLFSDGLIPINDRGRNSTPAPESTRSGSNTPRTAQTGSP